MAARRDEHPVLAPALLTGTSAEFLGRKPLPRVLRDRLVVFVLGPVGVGKSTVGRALAGPGHAEIDATALNAVLVDRVRTGEWGPWADAPSLLVDGPTFLQDRPSAVALFLELCAARAAAHRATVVCQSEPDGSVEALIRQCPPGAAVVLGLRFPRGRRSRLRTAEQICERLGLPRAAAAGTDALDPWRYDHLTAHLIERAVPRGGPDGSGH